MSDKIETPAAGAAAGTNEATAATADTKTTAAELKAAKKELAESVKRVAALEAENSRLHNEMDAKDQEILEIRASHSELSEHALGLEAKVDTLKLENEALQAIPKAEDNRILYTSVKGDIYEVVNPTFLYRGTNYDAADLIESGDTEVFEELIAAKTFILKKV